MLLEQPKTPVADPISIEGAKSVLSTGTWRDEDALKLVIQDTDRAESFESTKQWVMGWVSASALYQSPIVARFWEGTQVERANVPFFTLATAVNSLVPQIIKGLFYTDPPFMVSPRPGTKSNAARAFGDILAYQSEDINLREELRLGVTNALLYGTGIWKYGWEIYEKEESTYKRKVAPMQVPGPAPDSTIEITDDDEEIEEEVTTRVIDRPTFECIDNMRSVLVDPGLKRPDIRKAKYVIHRTYPTWDDLDELRKRPDVHLPDRDTLLKLLFPPKEQPVESPSENTYPNPLADARALPAYEPTTIDPFQQPLEMLERWDNKRYILVLQRKLVIASSENPFGSIPFFSVGWWDVPGAFWSLGLAKTIGSEQRIQQGVTNTWLDMLSLMLNGVYTRVKGQSVPTQNIRVAPGKVIDVDAKDSLTPLQRPQAVPEVLQAVQMSAGRVEQTSGASELMGGAGGALAHSNAARSAAGVTTLASGPASRAEEFVEKLTTQVVLPMLYAFYDLNKRLLPLKTAHYILDKELDHEFLKDTQSNVLDLYNARLKFSISAASKLLARRNMAQALPIMLQFLGSAPIINGLAVESKKVDVQELIRMMFEVSDWKNYNDVVVDMTPQDQQRWQQSQPGAVKQAEMQGKMALQQQAADNTSQLQNDKNIARAANEVLRQGIEQASEPVAVEGEAGGRGFGANAE